ncbi:protein D2-like [Dermacentor andersoni]|uniref:protein D2-like n=1 Tax=Dermacentor andersoni TaxID=34620 RepID=UPI0024171458|nr:protein D2-like [Dermacentor andersoni]
MGSKLAAPFALFAVVTLLQRPRFCACFLDEELRLSFTKSGIVTDVIPKVPKNLVVVTYPAGAHVQLGNTLTPEQTADVPDVRVPGDPDRWYTVILLDPDAPSRKDPKMRHWLHWLVVNVPQGETTTLTKYAGPTPPPGTGEHRYVFLVYKQQGVVTPNGLKGFGKERAKFNLTAFLEAADLNELVAANFFVAENK